MYAKSMCLKSSSLASDASLPAMILTTDQQLNTKGWSATAIAFLNLRDEVLRIWELQVRTLVEKAAGVRGPVLINTLPAFYDNIAQSLSPQSARSDATDGNNAASAHGGERARMTDYGPEHIVQEYQIFRSVIATVAKGKVALSADEWDVIDASINNAMIDAVRAYSLTHDSVRKRVAAALSHDMRTPLMIISNGTQLLRLANNLDRVQIVAGRINTAVHRLTGMMGDLVDSLTETTQSRMRLQLSEFEIQALLTAAVGEFDAVYPGRVELAGTRVRGFWDRDALLRAVENLINNATKYGDGGNIRIKADGIRGRLILTVHNSGDVIPAGHQDRIFEFLQRDTVDRDIEGSGIGLYYVRNVAEGHGGSVAVDSSAERGTTFLIDIPIDCRPFV